MHATTTMQTPWGPAETQTAFGPGIVAVTTASHGGFFVSPELRHTIPAAWRAASFNGQGQRGWFEEDCDWCMVALTFPDRFEPADVAAAISTFEGWLARKLTNPADRIIPPAATARMLAPSPVRPSLQTRIAVFTGWVEKGKPAPQPAWSGPIVDWMDNNPGIDMDEAREILLSLATRGEHHIGGGAAGCFTIRKA